jgi:hypothetical protein
VPNNASTTATAMRTIRRFIEISRSRKVPRKRLR